MLDQMNLRNICGTSHPKATDYTFLPSAQGTSSRNNHMLGHKVSFGKYKKTDVTLSIFSDHNAMRLELIYNINLLKKTATCDS